VADATRESSAYPEYTEPSPAFVGAALLRLEKDVFAGYLDETSEFAVLSYRAPTMLSSLLSFVRK